MNKQKRLLDWIDAHRDEIIGVLQDLIRIPSVNPWFFDQPAPSKEKDVQAYIAERMSRLGAAVDMWEPDAARLAKYEGMAGYYPGRDFTGRPNLAARFPGSGDGKSLLLIGHIDVVKAGSRWTKDPFAGTVEDGKLYGRGAVDMKGGVASMIMAVEALLRSGVKPRGSITVGTVVDEEAGGMGTLDFVDRGYRADASIMTEPTSLGIAPLCRGILWGKLTVHGRSGHIEMPQGDWRTGGAVDAIDRAMLYMDHFDRLNADWAIRKTHPLLPLPCQIYIAQFNAGEYPTAFANKAEIVFNAQYLPSERDDKWVGGNVKREIEDLIARVTATDPWLREHPPDIEWLVDADCAETDASHPFVRTCIDSLRQIGSEGKIEGLSFHTDMGWLVNVGIPTINFGPGDPRLAHHSDEYVPVDEVIDAVKMIALTIMEWCGTEGTDSD